MSTHWELVCRRCGVGTSWNDDGQSYMTNHISEQLAELVATGLLPDAIALANQIALCLRGGAAGDWGLVLTQDCGQGLAIDLSRLARPDCDHDFEPYDEYGRWAGPQSWPEWHPKASVLTGDTPTEGGATGEGHRCTD